MDLCEADGIRSVYQRIWRTLMSTLKNTFIHVPAVIAPPKLEQGTSPPPPNIHAVFPCLPFHFQRQRRRAI